MYDDCGLCSSWQIRFQPYAQASCSLHAWISEPSWASRHSSSTANFTLHFLPLSPGTTSELQEGLKLSFSWQIVNIVPLTATSSVCSCLPPTVTAIPSLPWGPGTRWPWAPPLGGHRWLCLWSHLDKEKHPLHLLGTMRTATTPPQSPPKRLSHWSSPF